MTDQIDEMNVTIETKEVEIKIDSDLPDVELTIESYPDVIVLPTSGRIGPQGPEGDPGPQGPMGLTGAPGTQTTYIFTQLSVVEQWDITHNLNRYPSVTVIDSGGSEIIPNIVYNSADVLTILFNYPTSGKAYLN